MKRRTTQRENKFSRRKVGWTLLFLLLLTHPAWALHLCHCRQPGALEFTACHNTQTPLAIAQHCAEAETPAPETQSEVLPPAAHCCDLTAEAEPVATFVAPPNPETFLPTAPLTSFVALAPINPTRFAYLLPLQTRSLYLAYSCLLI